MIPLFKYYPHQLGKLFYTHTKATDMHGDAFIEIGPCLLLKVATILQRTTISQTRSEKSALVHGAGQYEETPKVSCVY